MDPGAASDENDPEVVFFHVSHHLHWLSIVHLAMVEQFLRHVQQNDLFLSRDKILLAVSGGIDSVVMVHLFKKAGFKAAIAHCNFQLRGEASLQDAKFVEKLATDSGMPFYTTSFDTQRIADEGKISIQMAARDLRNAWFPELLRDHKYAAVATAHHLNDMLETLLLNVAKGTGMDGIAGIPVKHQHYVRPLLFASRNQIEQYAERESLSWREDASNATDDYQRNMIRHHVVPVLKEINPNLEETFSDTIFRLRAARDFARGYLKEFNVRNIYYDGRHVLIRIAELRAHRFGAVILWELLKDLGFNFDQCVEIVGKDHQSGAVFLSPTHQVTVSRDELVLGRRGGRSGISTAIPAHTRTVELDDKALTLEIKDRSQVTLGGNQAIARMDADQLVFPLVWRYWREGDRFVPLGMKQHKKVSDFLVDEKISLPDKDHVTVIESAGEIVWVVGLRVSEKVKVTESTARVLVARAGSTGLR